MRHVAIVSVRVVMDSYDAEDAALTAAQHLQDAGFDAVASTVSGVRYGMEREVSEEFDAPSSHLPA